ncbi:hypothetical protein ES332_A09G082200v1 [Gossypium tomentosum]|uniref:Uncharacterized protein n=1 Tax=Gossypium tomentosum TaxID=34277 RepID=A0A5D2NZR6_GOSTO|nr:hypothetical protein ES332_A09G082200v1 [Gossypium tomentosum]
MGPITEPPRQPPDRHRRPHRTAAGKDLEDSNTKPDRGKEKVRD